jgi:spore germination protein KA
MLKDWMFFKKENRNSKTKKRALNNRKINIHTLKEIFKENYDFNIKEVNFKDIKLYFLYLETIVDTQIIDEYILKPVIDMINSNSEIDNNDVLQNIEDGLLPHKSIETRENVEDTVKDILSGSIAIISSNIHNTSITLEVKKIEKRNTTEPTNENIIKGAKEAFIEDIRSNVSLIRNRLKTVDLKVQKIDVGDNIKTSVAVIYLDNIVDKELLEKILEKIKNIKTDKLISGGDFEEQIIDNKYSIFPQLIYTEKTDKVVANIIDGKIIVVIDGLPTVYILPAVINMFFQAPEDYSINYAVSTTIRILRYFATALSLLLPGFYICISVFHQEMVPTELAISIINSKKGEPFPTIIEVIFMLLAFEILIEASSRLPKTIGQTISIVGGLIIGEAAVNAKFVSPSVVVIIAVAGISGFLMPNQDFSNAIRMCRFILVILSGFAGLYGLSLGLFILVYYMCTIESFGLPYFIPFTSSDGKNLTKDTLIRSPMIDMKNKNK